MVATAKAQRGEEHETGQVRRGQEREDGARQAGHDAREDDEADAVADAALGDELADPHQQDRARRQGGWSPISVLKLVRSKSVTTLLFCGDESSAR